VEVKIQNLLTLPLLAAGLLYHTATGGLAGSATVAWAP